jgi:type VI secretion system secreted protein Hcp
MAVDNFLKIEGIDGESKDSKHANEIDVISWSFGATQLGSMAGGGGGGAGKVSMQDFTFQMQMCKATPKLLLHCANGKHIPSAIFTARKAGETQQEYMKVKFTDILVSSYQTGGGGENPMESISLNFAKIEFEYREQKADGTLDGPIPAGWDLKKNEKV